MSTSIRGLHDAGTTTRGDDEAMILRRKGQAPLREQAGQLAGFLVVASPLESPPTLAQLDLKLLFGIALTAGPQRAERSLGAFAAVDARRSEEHYGVLDALLPEPPQWL